MLGVVMVVGCACTRAHGRGETSFPKGVGRKGLLDSGPLLCTAS